jgi:hypothetical protein
MGGGQGLINRRSPPVVDMGRGDVLQLNLRLLLLLVDVSIGGCPELQMGSIAAAGVVTTLQMLWRGEHRVVKRVIRVMTVCTFHLIISTFGST